MCLSLLSMEIYIVFLASCIFAMLRLVDSQFRVAEEVLSRGCRGSRGQYAHETFCHQYYNCWDGRATVEQCPTELLFNSVTNKCDYPEAVNCAGRIRSLSPFVPGGRCLKEWGTFPDPNDCTAFYECSHGRAYHKYCPFFTAFDERYLVCVHAYEVECGGRGGVYGTLAPPIFPIDPSSGRADGGRSHIGSIEKERHYEKPTPAAPTFQCPHPRGLYGHPEDCSKFWLCREYKANLLKCPVGLLFDMSSLTCRQPELVQCTPYTR